MRMDLLRRISLFIAVAVLTGSLLMNAPAANAATVNDLGSSSAYARDAIQWMAGNNIISGDSFGNFYPKKSVSRAELVTLMVKALGIDTTNLPLQASFSDVPTSHWAFKYVEAATRAGIVSGMGNGKFGVNNTSTREQITTMLMNYLSVSKEAVLASLGISGLEKFSDEGKMSDWAKPSIQFALSNNLMSGTSTTVFSPGGSATKEQIAVILYKFLNTRETINQAVEGLRKPIVSFNGDVLTLTASPKVVNGEMYLPLETFRIIGAEVTIDEQSNKVTIKSTTSAGTITLNITSGNFIPMSAVVNALGMTAQWNQNTNLITITDTKSVNNLVLFNAMKGLLSYKGEYTSNMILAMKENISNEDFVMDYSMDGVINGLDSTSDTDLTISMTGAPDEQYVYNTITIGNTVYDMDQDTGEWTAYTKTEADDYGIVYTDVAAERASTQKILDAYRQIKVYNAGKVVLNGQNVTKYQLTISRDLLDSLIPEEVQTGGMGLEDIYNNGLDYKVEMYVNSQGQLVKQLARLTGSMVEQDVMDIDVIVTVATEYSNIGKDIEIVNPMK